MVLKGACRSRQRKTGSSPIDESPRRRQAPSSQGPPDAGRSSAGQGVERLEFAPSRKGAADGRMRWVERSARGNSAWASTPAGLKGRA